MTIVFQYSACFVLANPIPTGVKQSTVVKQIASFFAELSPRLPRSRGNEKSGGAGYFRFFPTFTN